MTPSPTPVQPSSQISGIQSADDPRILRKANSSVCRRKSNLADGTLNYLRTVMDEQTNLTLLSDDALADRIRFYDMQMQAAMKLEMKDEAHRNRQHFEAALRERHKRPNIVAHMEQYRGLV